MQKPDLLCIAHRGAMGHEPENTLSSISKALALGAPCVEVDVFCVDGRLVVFHDVRLERMTNGVGYLSEQSFEYLRSLDVSGGQRIFTLEEVCEVIDSQACLNIELRGPGTAAPVVELISNLIESGWDNDAILVSSFNHRELLEMKRLNHDILLGALIRGLLVDDSKFAEDLGAFSVHPSFDFVDRRFVDDAHARGLKVYVYTVNHPEDIAKMHKLGVDGVFTNFPERVLETYTQGEITTSWIG
ncbi:MAG: glycerophosphodiester phosphodiesterase family protein [Pseudomonadota bacterium]|nr:glycerophosphodiester phosphodiesterase family protein [Pseudomonadota bacterium]